ncbi:hypothetical protein CVT26_013826 [Gymnopilus dilepis]|uniref:Carboxylesterase type B domain-containing protein n=1 Tax=Gymnopilus dilepis TaxID=231916 RepID=A0A409VVY5_9AGAR|nr:hypothetical protein CVT26_013826 [Gymnopilus dilepis]
MRKWTYLLLLSSASFAAPLASPVAHLDAALVTGINNGTINKFLGIPFGHAPRFQLPQPVQPYVGHINASAFGPGCPSQLTVSPSPLIPFNFSPPAAGESEDCLSLNIYAPVGATPSSRLPVIVWIYGGGFELGNTESNDAHVTRIVKRSVELNLPLVQVSINYRGSAYGFLASKEVAKEKIGNFGLYDQLLGLEWVQKYIRSFGGDPSKVVIDGQSSGSISVALHLVAFGGNNEHLFRGAIMESGSPIAFGPMELGQQHYDALAKDTGCSNAKDTLQCLRTVPFDTLRDAVNASPNLLQYQAVNLAWGPRVDGVFLRDDPLNLVAAGKVTRVPVVNGDDDDEGTVFSFSQTNLTTDDDFKAYIHSNFYPAASDAELEPLWQAYPDDPSQGSPFDTGDANELYPQFKRVAAFQGDLAFEAPRRFFLQNISGKQIAWSYLAKVLKSTPFLGSFHGAEEAVTYLDDHIVYFATHLNPNTGSGTHWPQYTPKSPNLLTFNATNITIGIVFAQASPTVHLDAAIAHGINNGSINKFLGIPFGRAPRFQLPEAVPSYVGSINATAFGPACPQQASIQPPLLGDLPFVIPPPPTLTESEDCLSLNVYVPTTANSSDKLPVLFFIYGGGFETGATESSDFHVSRITQRSIDLNLPIIQVSVNYRVSAYGFLAGEEVAKEKIGNLGLYDQLLGLRWVHKYIEAFGGDPSRIIINGGSAGSISVSLQMLAFGGSNGHLFRGACMQSGSPIAFGSIESGQEFYDALVVDTGCTHAKDTLRCLRAVPFNTLRNAVNKSPSISNITSLRLAWGPRVDGIFLEDDPLKLIASGKVARVPVVSGDEDDEGTVFSLVQGNVTQTDADFKDYIKSNYFPSASEAELAKVWTTYPSDPSLGSPFGTGDMNQLYPQYKRLAAFQGDLLFQGPRRYFLNRISNEQKTWSYLGKVLKTVPFLGSLHGAEDIVPFLDDHIIYFTNSLDPNGPGTGSNWPQYSSSSPNLLTFLDNNVTDLSQDNFRAEGISVLLDLISKYPL